ncbi:MAG: hypothetical protein LBT46_05035 [Planctomycetaceae bacterium]|nr:hypothetical protein [Planctomycetaceae bacterium]
MHVVGRIAENGQRAVFLRKYVLYFIDRTDNAAACGGVNHTPRCFRNTGLDRAELCRAVLYFGTLYRTSAVLYRSAAGSIMEQWKLS